MEKCESVVVVSAIFNDHDKIRQPRGLGSQTLQNVCFFMFIDDITLKGLEYLGLISTKSREYKIGVWRIVKVSKEDLYQNPAMNGVIPKYLFHRLFPYSPIQYLDRCKVATNGWSTVAHSVTWYISECRHGYIKAPIFCSYHGRSHRNSTVEEMVGCECLEDANGDLLWKWIATMESHQAALCLG